MSRFRSFLILALLALATVGPIFVGAPAGAGDINDPNMTDAMGDATSGKAARDLIAGWVGNETEAVIEFDLQMASLEAWAPYADWQSFPVVYYEFFFDVTTSDRTD